MSAPGMQKKKKRPRVSKQQPAVNNKGRKVWLWSCQKLSTVTFPRSAAASGGLKCSLASRLQLLEGTGVSAARIRAGAEETGASSPFRRARGGEKQKVVLEKT